MLAALKEEIKASKSETEEMTKKEMDQIKTYEELMSKPDKHIAVLKDASEKLDKAEKQLLVAATDK
jgi:pyruvate-formate lyase